MKVGKMLAGIAGAALLAGAAIAADVGVKAGATVSDTNGGEVGTIESVTGDLAVVNTGANKVSLPVSAFGQGTNGPIIAMTKDQLDAAATGAKANAEADLKSQLAAGAHIYGPDGGVVGTVAESDAQFVTLDLGDQKVKLPLGSFAQGTRGATIGMTAGQLRAAAQQSATNATAAPSQN